MAWGGNRSGSGAKLRYSAVGQTNAQRQQRWRFTQCWEEQRPDGDVQGARPHMQKLGLSPLQVPGSKGWLVPWFRRYLSCFRRPRLFLEVFAGSAIVGLTMLVEERVEKLMLVEKDAGYVAVWQTVLGPDAAWLTTQILHLVPRRDTVGALLAQTPQCRREHAFQTLVKTWCYHRARLTKGFGLLPNQPSQPGRAAIATAWQPAKLVVSLRRITVHHGCGLEVMAAHAARRDVFTYADPPYPTAGERMYRYSAVDIPALLSACQQAHGPVVVSCEDHTDVTQGARARGLDVMPIYMHAGTNQQMREVLIANRPLPAEPLTGHEAAGPAPEQGSTPAQAAD